MSTRGALETSLGTNMNAVRVHTDHESGSVVDRLAARAFTVGTHIFLGPRERPGDLSLMAHEATHVLQQQGGASLQRKSETGSSDFLEREADLTAAAVGRGERVIVQGRTRGPRPQFLFDWVRRGVSAISSGVQAVAGAVTEIAGNVIERAVNYIRERARSIPGYDLLGFILGKDPLTQQPVERNAVNLIRGLLGLIPGGLAMFENLQRAGVIDKVFNWVTTELNKLNITWGVIRGAIDKFLSSLGPSDILNLGGVFDRARAIFGPILGRIGTFALAAGKKILEFIFEGALALGGGAAQRVLAIFRRIGATFSLIVNDPVRFLGNLINAVKGGFQRFAANILGHLKTALFDWLFGALEGAGITMPKQLNLEGILSIILQVLGLTYARMRERLVKLIGEPAVATLERVFEFLRIIVTKGIAAAWEKIIEFATGLVDTVIEGIRNWVITKIVTAAVTRLATMFNPVGAIINAIISIYNTVMFIIEKAKQIAAFVESVLDSIDNIARGNIGAAIEYVERTLARILSLAINFLASFLGLGGISTTIKNIISRIQAVVDRAIDKVLNWIVEKAKGLVQAGREAVGAIAGWWKKRVAFESEDGAAHAVYVEGDAETADIVVESKRTYLGDLIATITPTSSQKPAKDKHQKIRQLIKEGKKAKTKKEISDKADEIQVELKALATLLAAAGIHKGIPPAPTYRFKTNDGKADTAEVNNLSRVRPMGSEPRSGEEPKGWSYLQRTGQTTGPPFFRQMHLINKLFGGPGMQSNLAPGAQAANSDHLHGAENKIKELVGDEPNAPGKNAVVLSYKVKANYHASSKILDTSPKLQLLDFPKEFVCTWEYVDGWPKGNRKSKFGKHIVDQTYFTKPA